MRSLSGLLIGALALVSLLTSTPARSQTFSAYRQTGSGAIASVTTTSSTVSLGGSGSVGVVFNTGAVGIYFQTGNYAAVSATTSSTYVPAGAAAAFNATGMTHLAAVTASSTSSVSVSVGGGEPVLAGSSTGGSGGGGAVTVADGSDIAEGATADTVCATDSGTCSVVALTKRTNARLTTINTTLGSPALPTGAATAAKQPAIGTAGSASADVLSMQGVASGTPLSVAAVGITSITSSTVESSHVLKASAGSLYSVYVTAGATAGYLLVFNATSAPGDGAVTPAHCIPVVANRSSSLTFGIGPPGVFSTGITAVFSTTGCFTKTASATVFFSGSVQ